MHFFFTAVHSKQLHQIFLFSGTGSRISPELGPEQDSDLDSELHPKLNASLDS
jgi:hypothetical protein